MVKSDFNAKALEGGIPHYNIAGVAGGEFWKTSRQAIVCFAMGGHRSHLFFVESKMGFVNNFTQERWQVEPNSMLLVTALG